MPAILKSNIKVLNLVMPDLLADPGKAPKFSGSQFLPGYTGQCPLVWNSFLGLSCSSDAVRKLRVKCKGPLFVQEPGPTRQDYRDERPLPSFLSLRFPIGTMR